MVLYTRKCGQSASIETISVGLEVPKRIPDWTIISQPQDKAIYFALWTITVQKHATINLI